MIQNLNGQMVLSYEIPLQRKSETLIDLLKLGARLKTTINTHFMRGIGKTFALIEYAKQCNYIVVVSSKGKAMQFRKDYSFDKIYGQDDMWLRKMQVCVVDDDVNINKLLKDMECNIITGFYDPIINKEYEDKSIKEQITENLEEEIKSLSQVIVKTRENREYGTYKNLIISLKGVLELYNNEIDKNNNCINPVVNIHVECPNVENGKELINTLRELPNMAQQMVKDSKGNCQFSY